MKKRINIKKATLIFLLLFIGIIALDLIFMNDNYYEGRFFKILSLAMKRVFGQGVKLQYTLNVAKNDPDSSIVIDSSEKSSIVEYDDIDSQ